MSWKQNKYWTKVPSKNSCNDQVYWDSLYVRTLDKEVKGIDCVGMSVQLYRRGVCDFHSLLLQICDRILCQSLFDFHQGRLVPAAAAAAVVMLSSASSPRCWWLEVLSLWIVCFVAFGMSSRRFGVSITGTTLRPQYERRAGRGVCLGSTFPA